MDNFKKQLEELQVLASDWLKFSQRANGWNCKTYLEPEKVKVWCYFADDGGHRSVKIGGIEIAYYSTITFSDFTFRNLNKLSDTIKHARELLNERILEEDERTEAEKQDRKKERVTFLESELLELAGK